jgi:hypothetical protein
MSFHQDLSTQTDVGGGPHVRAIGWLTASHPFTAGPSPFAFVERLEQFVALGSVSSDLLDFPAFMGGHTCEFCGKAYGYANLAVASDSALYIAPELVLHYVRAHSYLPPDEFVEAVLCAPLPGSAEFGALVERFPRLTFPLGFQRSAG